MSSGLLPAHGYTAVGADERRFPWRRLAAACSLLAVAALVAASFGGRPGQLRHRGAPLVELSEQDSRSRQHSLDERLDNGKNVYYTFNITLGGQTIKVIPDTGSFALVVTSTRCPKELCIRHAFDPDTATGYTRLDGEALMDFGSGQLWTKASRAPLAVGPFEAQQQQTFREIVKMDDHFSRLWRRVTYDGILGLSWLPRVPTRANQAGTNDTAFNETTVLENFGVESFAVCLTKATYDSQMRWTFGQSRFYWNRPDALGTPKFTYLDVVGKHHWQVELRNVSVMLEGGAIYPVACYERPCSVMIDTGSGVFTAPAEQHARLRRRLGPIDGKCLNFDILPSIRLRLGGEGHRGLDVTLPPRVYADKLVLPPIPHTPLGERRLCTLNFEALDFPEGDIWTFGHPFLQNFLVEYDRKRRQVGVLERGPSGGCPGHRQHLATSADLVNARSGAVELEHGTARRY